MLKMKKRILMIITIIITAVIFLHSMMSGVNSAAESDTAYRLFDRLTSFLRLPNFFDEFTIRKLAHFIEFAVLGFFLSATVHAYSGRFKNHIYKILFFMLAIPITDEFIQYFSDGRNSQIKDAILDFSGGVFGFLCFWGLSVLALHNNKKEE